MIAGDRAHYAPKEKCIPGAGAIGLPHRGGELAGEVQLARRDAFVLLDDRVEQSLVVLAVLEAEDAVVSLGAGAGPVRRKVIS